MSYNGDDILNKYGGSGSNYVEQARKAEKMKSLIEQEKILQDIISQMGERAMQMPSEAKQPRALKDTIAERIDITQRQLERLNQAKTELEGLKVSEGDAAFHPDLGNVIVRRFFVGDATTTIAVRKEHDGKIMAEVVGAYQQTSVLAEELVPVTEATKVLFGKK